MSLDDALGLPKKILKKSTKKSVEKPKVEPEPVIDEPEEPIELTIEELKEQADKYGIDTLYLSEDELKIKILEAKRSARSVLKELDYQKWSYSCPCRKGHPYKKVKTILGDPPMDFCRYCGSPMQAKKAK